MSFTGHFVCITLLFWSSSGDKIPDVIRVACERDSRLPYCNEKNQTASSEISAQRKILEDRLLQTKTTFTLNDKEKRAYDSPVLSNEDKMRITAIAQAVDKVGKNPFLQDGVALPPSKTHEDADLREKEIAITDTEVPEEGFIPEDNSHGKLREKETEHDTDETDERSGPFHGNKEQYCEKYEQHFSYYCVGETDQSGRGNVVSRFCPSYKKACPNKSTTSPASLTSWPSNSFDKVLTTNHPAREAVSESDESEEDEPSPREVYYSELKRRFPCKPDCDQLLFPHCTPECKCDYIYPIVQKFCNPPPIPLFLNTCRLWYAGCPKYEQYHYASQFVYSKAEKGKKVAGPQPTNPNPFNIPSPAGVPPIHKSLSRVAGQPTKEELYAERPLPLRPIAHSSSTLVVPPPIPHMQQKSDVEVISTEEKKNTKYARRSKVKRHFHGEFDHHGKGHINKRRRYSDTDILTTQKTLSKKELYQSLKALNSLTSNPVSLLKEPASLITGQQTTNAQESERNVEGTNKKQPRAHQANTFPVIPSDAAFGANDNTFKAFDGLTDSSGRLHRPRSRSPFTKPGLWEANPDNPHNRDHANKFWYHPESVSVDWLNGQIAWGAHWAVPAIGTGGTDGFSTVHFPTIGSFLNIPDDYD